MQQENNRYHRQTELQILSKAYQIAVSWEGKRKTLKLSSKDRKGSMRHLEKKLWKLRSNLLRSFLTMFLIDAFIFNLRFLDMVINGITILVTEGLEFILGTETLVYEYIILLILAIPFYLVSLIITCVIGVFRNRSIRKYNEQLNELNGLVATYNGKIQSYIPIKHACSDNLKDFYEKIQKGATLSKCIDADNKAMAIARKKAMYKLGVVIIIFAAVIYGVVAHLIPSIIAHQNAIVDTTVSILTYIVVIIFIFSIPIVYLVGGMLVGIIGIKPDGSKKDSGNEHIGQATKSATSNQQQANQAGLAERARQEARLEDEANRYANQKANAKFEEDMKRINGNFIKNTNIANGIYKKNSSKGK